MKKSFWSTKTNDMTIGDATKWVAWLCIVATVLTYGIVGIVIFWDNVCEWCTDKLNKIKTFFGCNRGKREAKEEGLD